MVVVLVSADGRGCPSKVLGLGYGHIIMDRDLMDKGVAFQGRDWGWRRL